MNSQLVERIVLKTRNADELAVMVLYDSGASKTFCTMSLAKAVAEDLRQIEHPFFACSIAGKIKIEYAAKLRIKINNKTNMILWCFVLPEINQTVPRAELKVPKQVYNVFRLDKDYFNRRRGHLSIIFGSDCQAEFFPTEKKTFGHVAIYRSRLTRNYIAVGAQNIALLQSKESPNLEVLNFIAFTGITEDNQTSVVDEAIVKSQQNVQENTMVNKIWEKARPVSLDNELLTLKTKQRILNIDTEINKQFRSTDDHPDTINTISQSNNQLLKFDINRVSKELVEIHNMPQRVVQELSLIHI